MEESPITVFWDIEHCPIPEGLKGFQVVVAIRNYARSLGVVKNISALGNLSSIKKESRTELQQSGVLLQDLTSGKLGVDMALMVEFLKLACDQKPPHHIILITGDRDFSNVLNVLVFRGYDVTLIHTRDASPVLTNAATNALEWLSFLGVPRASSPNDFPLEDAIDSDSDQESVESSEVLNSSTDEEVVEYIKKCINDGGKGKMLMAMIGGFLHEKRQDLWLYVKEMGGITPFVTSKSDIFSVRKNEKGHNEVYINNGITPVEYERFRQYLRTALKSLKKDFLKPTEPILRNAIQPIFAASKQFLTDSLWRKVICVANLDASFTVMGTFPNISVYITGDIFDGADPNNPTGTHFSDYHWDDLRHFLANVHPVKKKGRYGFALYLKEKGPSSIQKLPLGLITSFVQLALGRDLLAHRHGFFYSVLSGTSSPANSESQEAEEVDVSSHLRIKYLGTDFPADFKQVALSVARDCFVFVSEKRKRVLAYIHCHSVDDAIRLQQTGLRVGLHTFTDLTFRKCPNLPSCPGCSSDPLSWATSMKDLSNSAHSSEGSLNSSGSSGSSFFSSSFPGIIGSELARGYQNNLPVEPWMLTEDLIQRPNWTEGPEMEMSVEE